MTPGRLQVRGSGSGRRVSLAALLVLGVLLSGCDGRNLFQPVTEPPTILTLTAPSVAALGSPMVVTVRAVGVAVVDSMHFSVEGEVVDTQVGVRLEEPGTDVTQSIQFQIPETIPDDLLSITVVAIDEEGNESAPRGASVAILDGIRPEVEGSVESGTVGQGETLRADVSAEDNRGLDLIGMRIRDPGGSPVATRVQAVSGAAASAVLSWEVPVDQEPGIYRVEGYADDSSQNRTVVNLGDVVIERRDRDPPVVTVENPEEGAVFGTSDSILVRVRVQDAGLFQTVQIRGLAFRGDPDLGTDETVERFSPWTIELDAPVADTTLTRYLRPASDDDTAETVSVIVTATDLAGNEGESSVDVQVDPEADPEGDPEEGS